MKHDPTIIHPETRLIVPPGKKKGLLYPTEPPGKVCGFFRDVPGVDIIPIEEWDEYIPKIDGMREDVWLIYDQDGIGSCAAESGYGGLDLSRELSGLPRVRFNPWGTYYYSSGGRDQGSTLHENLRLLREMGAFPEELHPRSLGWNRKPSEQAHTEAKKYRIDEFYEISSWEEFGSALLHRFPVYWGYTGHAILATDLLNKSQFIYRNSWSDRWGDQGFGTISASRIEWAYRVYCIRSTITEQGSLTA